jgi:hypothetical protein
VSGGWEEEVKRRLESPEFRDKAASLTFNATGDAIAVRVKDEGKGFDWRRYLELSPERLTDLHGRGIAISGKVAFTALNIWGAGMKWSVQSNEERNRHREKPALP